MTKHEALLANARECVDRDLDLAGWRGVMAYVGTALVACAKQSERHDAALVMGSAMGYMAEFAGCGQSKTCHHANQCALCPHAEWPDSPVAAQTDPETHNPALETQTANTSESGAVQIDVAELLTAEEDHIPDATKKPSLCKWTYDELEGKWDTECGNAFWFADTIETPSNNGFKYCAYCGGAITSKKEEE